MLYLDLCGGLPFTSERVAEAGSMVRILRVMGERQRKADTITRNPITLFQSRDLTLINMPPGWDYNEDGEWVEFKYDLPELWESQPRSLRQAAEEERCMPLSTFLRALHKCCRGEHVFESWTTIAVFGTVEEAQKHGETCHYRYPDGWRHFTVCAEGMLGDLIAWAMREAREAQEEVGK